jgi:hypothetical protein
MPRVLPQRECLTRIGHRLLVAGLLCFHFASAGQTKTIHLRNEVITTESPSRATGCR